MPAYPIEFWPLICTGMVGLFVGLSELINRYKSFAYIFLNPYSWGYMMLNLLAAILTYYIVVKYNIDLGPLKAHRIGLVLACGLGAMAFLRSSFFNYRDSAGKVIEVGPAAILTIFLRAAERQFDQSIAEAYIGKISKLMKDISFQSASKDLPLIVLSSMQVLNDEEQKLLSNEVLKLVNDPNATLEVKNIALGTMLVKYTGFDLLAQCVVNLKEIYNTKTKSDIQKLDDAEQKFKNI